MSNLGWMFYKDYFRDLDYSNLSNSANEMRLKQKVKKLLETQPILESNSDEDLLGNIHIQATTTYPGLLLGSGNIHELPDVEGQLILGFSFDYTTGLPVIAGSSVKGVLRSAFEHPEYVGELLDNKFNTDEIKEIEKEIFDNGDIFFDAVVIRKGSTLLSDDYLAPHNDELKEPIPLRFLKVSPNVTFRFDFDLKNGILNKDEKKSLFIAILEDLGLGAKTNVGYGKFTNFTISKTQKEILEERKLEDRKIVDEATTIEELEDFLREHSNSHLKDEAEEKMNKLKEEKAKEDIKRAWENVDKTKPLHIQAFLKKNESNELATEYVKEAKALLSGNQNSSEEFDVSPYTKFKPLESYLRKINSLNESEVEILKNHILNNMNDKIKRKKFPFGTLKKFMTQDEANELADRLGL